MTLSYIESYTYKAQHNLCSTCAVFYMYMIQYMKVSRVRFTCAQHYLIQVKSTPDTFHRKCTTPNIHQNGKLRFLVSRGTNPNGKFGPFLFCTGEFEFSVLANGGGVHFQWETVKKKKQGRHPRNKWFVTEKKKYFGDSITYIS